MKIFNGHYDPTLNKIVGCQPYSRTWFHEKRHQKQTKNKYYDSIEMYSHGIGYYAAFASLAMIPFFDLWYFAFIISWLPYTFCLLFAELDAWIFGNLNWLKHKRHIKRTKY